MKKMKGLWNVALVFVISIAMLLGNFSIAAFAETREAVNASLAQGSMQTEVELDHDFDVPDASGNYTVTVTAPNGQNKEIKSGKVTADQRGIYVVKIDGEALPHPYTYNVYCKESGDFTLKIANEYDIPSYIAKGEKKTLPKAMFIDEDGNEVEDVQIDVEVVNSKSEKTTLTAQDNGYEYTFNEPGSAYVTYKVKEAGKENSKRYNSYTKEYEVKVQDGFSDSTNPKLTVSGVPSSAQVNNKVTLPVATATDDVDARVEIKVTVTAPNGDIYEAEVDEDSGYAVDFTDKKVVFDNADNRVFYPAETGTYTIVYQAFDDNGNKSPEFKYYLNVTNNNPATLVNGDEIDETIPSKWGFKVRGANGAASQIIHFPMPDFRHQKSDSTITVSFTISNDDTSRLVYFEDIANAFEQGVVKGASEVNGYDKKAEELEFTKDGFDFDPSLIKDQKSGTYTVVYRSRVNSRTRTKTVTFDLQDTYYDRTAPSVEDIETVQYIILEEGNTFTVPTVSYSDKEDAKTTLVYTLNNVDITDYQGKDLTIAKEGEGYFFENEDGEKVVDITAETGLTLDYFARDMVGNESNHKSKPIRVAQTSEFTVGNINESIDTSEFNRAEKGTNEVTMGGFDITGVTDSMLVGYEISVLDPDGNDVVVQESRIENEETIYVRNITFTAVDEGEYTLFIRVFSHNGESQVFAFTKTVSGIIKSGSTNGATTSAVVFDTKENNKIGEKYELPRADIDNEYLQVVTIKANRHFVMGDTFTPMTTGTVQVFNNTIEKEKFEGSFEFAESDLLEGKLSRYVYGAVTDPDAPVINVESISPKADVAETNAGFDPDINIFKLDNDNVKWYVSADKLTEEYNGKGAWFVLSEVTAYTKNGPATKITVTINYGSSSMTSTSVAEDENAGNIRRVYYNIAEDYYTLNEDDALNDKDNFVFANRWAFLATENAVYTISYKAESNGSAQSASVSQRLVVGDVVAPTIKISLENADGKGFRIYNGNEPVTSGYKSGNKFRFDFDEDNVATDGDAKSDVSVKFELINNSTSVYDSKSFNNNSDWITLSNLKNKLDGQDGYELGTGSYTVRITVKDKYNNESVKTFEFTVSATQSAMSVPLTVLTWVLSILAVILIVFVVIYIVRLRKIKK